MTIQRINRLMKYHHNVPTIPKMIHGLTPWYAATTARNENGKSRLSWMSVVVLCFVALVMASFVERVMLGQRRGRNGLQNIRFYRIFSMCG
jgi:uncharacterized membrane protein